MEPFRWTCQCRPTKNINTTALYRHMIWSRKKEKKNIYIYISRTFFVGTINFKENNDIYIYTHTHTQLYIYIYKAWRQLHKNAASSIKQIYWGSTPQSSSCTATYHPSWKLSKLIEKDSRTLLEKLERTHKWHTLVEPITWTSKGRTTS